MPRGIGYSREGSEGNEGGGVYKELSTCATFSVFGRHESHDRYTLNHHVCLGISA